MPPSSLGRLAMVAVACLALVTSGIDHAPPPDNPAVAPESRPDDWLARHDELVEEAGRGGIDLLFLGDSITAYWRDAAPEVWARHYAPRKAANFGIGGDHTQHLLWRLDHGELEGIRPRVVVLMIGTNNLANDEEGRVTEGVKAVLERLRLVLPASKVLLMGVTPRALNFDPSQATTAPDPKVPRLNLKLAGLADGRAVRFLDLGPALLDDRGRLPQVVFPDYLHLSRKGYRAWAEAMEPTLWEMMKAP